MKCDEKLFLTKERKIKVKAKEKEKIGKTDKREVQSKRKLKKNLHKL